MLSKAFYVFLECLERFQKITRTLRPFSQLLLLYSVLKIKCIPVVARSVRVPFSTEPGTCLKTAVSHIPQFGDATTSPTGDAASPAGDVNVSAGDAHL
jgi:hypothetical protein